MVESWISLFLRHFATVLRCANICEVSRCLQDKTASNSSVGTTLELTGIPTLATYLVARKTKLEQKQKRRERTQGKKWEEIINLFFVLMYWNEKEVSHIYSKQNVITDVTVDNSHNGRNGRNNLRTVEMFVTVKNFHQHS